MRPYPHPREERNLGDTPKPRQRPAAPFWRDHVGAHCSRPGPHRGVQRGFAPLRIFCPPKSGGQGVEGGL